MALEDISLKHNQKQISFDTGRMTRVQRGAYHDLVAYIIQVGHLTLAQIKKVLNEDFEACWDALDLVLKVDEEGKYFIGWIDEAISETIELSIKQKSNIKKRWNRKTESRSKITQKSIPPYNSGNTKVDFGNTTVIPISTTTASAVDEEEVEGVQGETQKSPVGMEAASEAARKSFDDVRWRESVCMGNGINLDQLKKWMAQFNASVSNDFVPNFNDRAYRKMMVGWMQKRMARGHTVRDDNLPEKLYAPPLKQVQNV